MKSLPNITNIPTSSVSDRESLYARGKALFEAERYLAAKECFHEALNLNPEAASLHFYLGNCEKRLGNPLLALECFKRALELEPGMFEAAGNLGILLLDLGAYDEAEDLFQSLMKAYPQERFFEQHYALALHKGLQLEASREALEKLLGQFPNDWELLHNLGNVHLDLGHLPLAIKYLRQACLLKPEHHLTHLSLGYALLLAGDDDSGWKEYEWRRKEPRRRFHRYERPNRLKTTGWDGQPEPAKSLLIWAEEGIGDTLMWLRFMPLIAMRVGQLIFECQPGLRPLLNQVTYISQLISRGEPLVPHDFNLPLMSTCHVLGISPEDQSLSIPYLFADQERINAYQVLRSVWDGKVILNIPSTIFVQSL